MVTSSQEYILMIFNFNLLISFLLTFFTGIFTIPFLILFSQKTKKFVDIAEGDILKIHKNPISFLGGLAIVVSIGIGFLWAPEKIPFASRLALYVGALVIFLLGFWDDTKWKHISLTKPLIKFPLLIICAFLSAIALSFAHIQFNFISLPLVALTCTALYIFVVINAVNYQDGMDGLAGGLVALSLLGFMVLAWLTGNYLAFGICVITLAAVIAFLVFNFPGAKIFMGDSGAYSLGFMLSAVAIIFSKSYDTMSVVGPIFIIGLPVFDGVFTNMRRLANGKSIFIGDRLHCYDQLLQKGYSTKKTLTVCYSLQSVLVLIGILLYTLHV